MAILNFLTAAMAFAPMANVYPPQYAMALVKMPVVIQDLHLTSDQRARITADEQRRAEQLQPEYQAALQRWSGQRRGQEVGKLFLEYYRSGDAAVFDFLNRRQKERLRALQYQSLGFRALLQPDLVARLSLHQDQVEAIQKLTDRIANERGDTERAVRMVMAPNVADQKEKLAQIERDSESQADSILTAKQRFKYHRLLGLPLASVLGSSPFVQMIAVD